MPTPRRHLRTGWKHPSSLVAVVKEEFVSKPELEGSSFEVDSRTRTLPQAKLLISQERRNIQSLLAAGAVWLNLGSPRQPKGRRPEGCRGGPRCSQTAPATRRDCVYHHGTETRREQVNLEKTEFEEKTFGLEKATETFTLASAKRDCKYQP